MTRPVSPRLLSSPHHWRRSESGCSGAWPRRASNSAASSSCCSSAGWSLRTPTWKSVTPCPPARGVSRSVLVICGKTTSMLFRLSLHGVPAGGRWEELADKAEARIGDTLSAFTLPHWMMALCGAGRWAAADRLLDSLRDAARSNAGTNGPLVARYALPVAEAVLKHAQGDHADAVAAMRPAL